MNTHLEIRRPAFSRLLKAEVAEFAKKTIGIVESKDPESLLISPVYEPLLALEPEIELLSLRFGIDPERVKVETLKSKLMLTVSHLKLQVRLLSKSNNDEGIYVIGSFIDTYLRHLSFRKNDKQIVQNVDGFLISANDDVAFSEALTEHDLMGEIAQIEAALSAYRAAIENRVRLLSERPKVKTRVIVSKIVQAIKNLFKGIEVAQIMNTELDYIPLIDELNELVEGFRLTVILRAAYNKRKAQEEYHTTGVQTTSNKPYDGYNPYLLSIMPNNEAGDSSNGEPIGDEEDEGETVEGAYGDEGDANEGEA